MLTLASVLGVVVLFAVFLAVSSAELANMDISDTKIDVTIVSSLPGAHERVLTVDMREDDVLTECRETCREEGISEAHCVRLLKLFVSKMVEVTTEESSLSYLRYGSSMNAILIRNYENDNLTAAVTRMGEGEEDSEVNEERKIAYNLRLPPLHVFYHIDSTNNLGDLWSTYIFIHYANRLGLKREIDMARENTTTFVTSVGSTLQWLFNRHEVDRRLIASKEDVINDHISSGLRTSIGNGFIVEDAESFLYDSYLVDIVGVRGPLTRGILNRNLHRYPPVISDPGLLASRIYPASQAPPPPSELKELGFVVHESHRDIFRKLFPAFQDSLIDNHIFLNAQTFFDQLRSYRHVVSSSLHGIIFAHTYGIPVLPVVFRDRESNSTDSVLGGDFKYMDYYLSVGHTQFVGRVPLSQTTFRGLEADEVRHRLALMAAEYWQPDPDTLESLRDLQEGLITDYLELYRDAHDPALSRSADCLQSASTLHAAASSETSVDGTPSPSTSSIHMPSLRQEHLFRQSLSEIYSDMECPQKCVEQMDIGIAHATAVNRVGPLEMRLTFPLKLVERVQRLAQLLGKSMAFTFVGHSKEFSARRHWVFSFDADSEHSVEERAAWPLTRTRESLVKHNERSRSSRKHLFDYEYYNSLAMANFTLCPAGHFGWTYRFLEAIMAMSIPVVSSTDTVYNPHIDEGYFYYEYAPTDSVEEHEQQVRAFVYLEDEARRNYELLLEHHVINEAAAEVIREKNPC
jgi:hypothetical protein